MSARISSSSHRYLTVHCKNLRQTRSDVDDVDDRQRKVPGFNQCRLGEAVVGLIGCGGLMAPVATGGVRKGIGHLILFDGDTVELSNLNRQQFTEMDLGKNKALRLARHLRSEGYMGSVVTAYPFYFQEALEHGVHHDFDVLACGVDNDRSRLFTARYGLEHRVPVVFSGVSEDANQGYAFVQENDGPCLVCAFPQVVVPYPTPCPGSPAVKDILNVLSGFTLYAIDTLLMERERTWNYRMIHLAGYAPDSKRLIERNPDCPLCGVVKEPTHETA